MLLQEFIFDAITQERARQDKKFGVQKHNPPKWFLILSEEVGEVAKALNEEQEVEYVRELVQVAASAVAALEDYVRLVGSRVEFRDLRKPQILQKLLQG